MTNDIIGRNGHMRWPEVKELIDGIWAFLDDSKKFNHQLQRLDSEFIDWDCSTEGFEGIRAQDILPLRVSRFRFDAFLACGGLVDIFVDRAFGHNFDTDNPKDVAFIDFLELLNEKLIDAGLIKPTMIYAITGSGREPRTYRHWTPEFCVRPTTAESTNKLRIACMHRWQLTTPMHQCVQIATARIMSRNPMSHAPGYQEPALPAMPRFTINIKPAYMAQP